MTIEEQLEQANNKLATLTKELTASQQLCEEVSKQNTNLTTERDSLVKAKEELSEKNSSIEKSLQEAQGKISQLEADKQAAHEKAAQMLASVGQPPVSGIKTETSKTDLQHLSGLDRTRAALAQKNQSKK